MPVNPNLENRDQSIPDIILPEHLRLSGPGNWRAYKHAVETACRLKGVAESLTMINAGEPEREELCKAIITLNVVDFPAYGVPAGEGVHAREVWARLCEIHRPKRTCWGLTEWVRTPTRVEWFLLWLLVVMAALLGLWHPRATPSLLECELVHGPMIGLPPMGYYRDLLRDYHSSSY
ncbi:hypothetical protein V8D89_011676 [Ganoderma adspersum]